MRAIVLTLCTLIEIYAWVVFAYILLSWFPKNGVLGKIYYALGTICEPFLRIFRRFIPPLRMGAMAMDFSPIVAFFALQLVEYLIRIIFL